MNELSDEKKEHIIMLLDEGKSYRYIVNKVGVAKGTILRLAGIHKRIHKRIHWQISLDKDPNPSGLCLCGCGQRTTICKNNNYQTGMKKDYHYRYIHQHWSNTIPRGKEDSYGYTQYERKQRDNAIWRFLYDLLPVRPMKRTEVFDLVIPRWPEKKKCGISHVINRWDELRRYIIPEPILTKHCVWCGKDITDRRLRWCSRECERAEKAERKRKILVHRTPILQPISLLCRDFHSHEHDCLAHLAFDLVKTKTGAYYPNLIASAWIGICEAWEAGVRNKPDLISAGQSEIKKFYKEDRISYLSVDSLKDDYGLNISISEAKQRQILRQIKESEGKKDNQNGL